MIDLNSPDPNRRTSPSPTDDSPMEDRSLASTAGLPRSGIQPSPSGPDASCASATEYAEDHDQQFQGRPLLFGSAELRAIWSLLIYLGMVGVFVAALYFLNHQIQQAGHQAEQAAAAKSANPAKEVKNFGFAPEPGQPMPMTVMIISEVMLFSGFFFFSWIMATIEDRPISVFGLGGTRPIARFLTGAVWGILAISLLILTLHGLHLLVFDSRLDHGGSILFWGLIQLFAFFLVGLSEEYTFRGYIQFTLTRGMVTVGNLFSKRHARTIAFWIASVITSSIFLLAHKPNPGEDWYGLIQVFLIGLVFLLALWRTGSLWWGIGFHMAWDWGQSFLYGVPDSGGLMQGRLFATHAVGKPLLSGGSVGPEGSILCIPIILLLLPVLYFTHPSPQPSLETDA